MIITIKITKQDNKKTELFGWFDGREISVDPCVGCAIPYSIFKNYNFIGNTYSFDGSWYSDNEKIFLPNEMYDPNE